MNLKLRSDSTKNLVTALIKAKNNFKTPIFDKEGQHKFKYASVKSILTAINFALQEQNILLTQEEYVQEEKYYLLTTVRYEEEFLISLSPILVDPRSKNCYAQNYGSALTYARRYSLSSFFGIYADELDPDAVDFQKEKEVTISKEEVLFLESKMNQQQINATLKFYKISTLYDLTFLNYSKCLKSLIIKKE